MAGGNIPSERPLDRAASDRSVRLEGTAAISHPRPRFCLWRGLHTAYQGYGHSRPTDLGAVAMAERIPGEAHRVRSGGTVLTTWLCLGTTPSPSATVVPEILQRRAHALVSAQGRARTTRGAGSWPGTFGADLGRATASICSRLSFRQGQESPTLPDFPRLTRASVEDGAFVTHYVLGQIGARDAGGVVRVIGALGSLTSSARHRPAIPKAAATTATAHFMESPAIGHRAVHLCCFI